MTFYNNNNNNNNGDNNNSKVIIIVIKVDIRMFLEWENNSGKIQKGEISK